MQKYVILMKNSKFVSLQPETFVRIKIIEMGIVEECIHHSKSHMILTSKIRNKMSSVSYSYESNTFK